MRYEKGIPDTDEVSWSSLPPMLFRDVDSEELIPNNPEPPHIDEYFEDYGDGGDDGYKDYGGDEDAREYSLKGKIMDYLLEHESKDDQLSIDKIKSAVGNNAEEILGVMKAEGMLVEYKLGYFKLVKKPGF